MPDRPNVVLCICDQLRAHEVGCYGNRIVRTPNIDRLAAGGVRFEHAISSNPVCMPARSCTLSGQYSRTCMGVLGNYAAPAPGGRNVMPAYPVRDRAHLPDPTLPEVLREAGYHTELIGKWHVHPAPEVVGFDHALYPRVNHRHTGQHFLETGQEERLIEGYSVDFEAERMREFLDAPHDRPFFLYYAISPPHMPLMDAPERYRTMFRPSDVPLRLNVFREDRMAHDEEWFRIYCWDFLYYQEKLPHTLQLPDGFDLRRLTALYYGLTTWVDDMVGHLLDGLAANGLTENTLVLFVSDHGDMLGSHHLFNKDCLYEEAISVPLAVSLPGWLRPRVVTDQVAQLVDVMPTVLAMCGIDAPTHVQGRDLSPVLDGRVASLAEPYAFVETSVGEIGIRTPRYMLGARLAEDLRRVAVPLHCFFDLETDPYQERNLAGAGEPEVASELRERLLRWNAETRWMRNHPAM